MPLAAVRVDGYPECVQGEALFLEAERRQIAADTLAVLRECGHLVGSEPVQFGASLQLGDLCLEVFLLALDTRDFLLDQFPRKLVTLSGGVATHQPLLLLLTLREQATGGFQVSAHGLVWLFRLLALDFRRHALGIAQDVDDFAPYPRLDTRNVTGGTEL